MMTFIETYKSLSVEDKAALNTLKAEEEARTGRALTSGDVLKATTPGFDDPSYLTVTASAVADTEAAAPAQAAAAPTA